MKGASRRAALCVLVALAMVAVAVSAVTIRSGTDAAPAGSTTGAEPGTGGPGVTSGGTPGTDAVDPLPTPTTDPRTSPFGLCPGASPEDGGAQRHADAARDSSGRLHMVWQERFGGQFDVCYARQADAKEMGLGSDANPAWRITRTPSDSVRPRLGIDPESGIVYVVWTELLPPEAMDAESGARRQQSFFYTATAAFEPTTEPLWTPPQVLGRAIREGMQIQVSDSAWTLRQIGAPLPGVGGVTNPKPSEGGAEKEEPETLRGTYDTDRDGIRDSWEVKGTLGWVTAWWDPDTDGDGLRDLSEIREKFDPTIDDRLISKDFLRVVLLYSDLDHDGLTLLRESACDFPVTAGTANILDGGHVLYRFFPNATYTASLILGIQVKRQGILFVPPPTVANYTLNVTADAGPAIAVTFSYSGSSLEGDRVTINVGSFAVTPNALTTVRIEATVEQPPSNGFRTFAIWSAMIAAPSPDFEHFNYKEGRDYDEGQSADAARLTENFEVCGDPNRPDLFLEIDSLTGHAPTSDVYSETINGYSDAGVLLHYRIDQSGLPLGTGTSPDTDGDGAQTIRNDDEAQDLLGTTKNPSLPDYLHVVFAHKFWVDDVGWVYGGAMSADTEADLAHSGIVFADQELIDTVTASSSLMERRLKVLMHEVGHAIGTSHEGPFGYTPAGSYDPRVDGACCADTFDGYNVIRQGGLTDLFAADMLLRGVGNLDRNKGATSLIGRPRFSVESVDQFDLTNKLSVDTGRNIDLLGDFV